MRREPNDSEDRPAYPFGWRILATVAACYAACVCLATWPRVLSFRTMLPSLPDPLQHLWIMRWYKVCLLEGRSPILCPEIQYPTGAPLGCFSPLHFQSLLYLPLAFAIQNDVLCYNLLWLLGIVLTGLGTFWLIGQTVRDPWCAGFGGMLAMLSGPMMLHATAHLELIYLGGFPLFLWAWVRFVDQPRRGRLLAAAGSYALLGLIAAYYAVFAVFPAALYALWHLWMQPAGEYGAWLRRRVGWFAAFVGLVVPGLLFELGNPLWALAHGYVFGRPVSEFNIHGAPLWTYILPTWLHPLGRLMPETPYRTPGIGDRMGECGSYLGVVALGLIGWAAGARARFARASYWWSALVLLVVLAGGASWTLAGYEIGLPGAWMKTHLFLFRMIRVPARFNLFVAVVAALLASVGLRDLLARLPNRPIRVLTFALLAVAALADLSFAPLHGIAIPATPGCYAFIKATEPGAAIVEFPQVSSGGSVLSSVCGYWQSIHRLRTNVGYSGQGNAIFDNLLTWNSPFAASRLADPAYLADPDRVEIDVVGAVAFRDYAWLYLSAHGFRYAVLHQWPGSATEQPVHLDRIKAELAVAKVYEDGATIVYDRARLPVPRHPVLLTSEGWRPGWEGKMLRIANRRARLLLYNPASEGGFRVRLDAHAFQESRAVRLLAGTTELARWSVSPGAFQALESPALALPAGLHELTLESDGDVRPKNWRDASLVGDMTPYSLKIATVRVAAVPGLARREGAPTAPGDMKTIR